jgi:hypothetical protein
MNKAVEMEAVEHEGETLADLEQEWQETQAEAEDLENQPSKAEQQQAEALAARINTGFLWLVNRTQCPHVHIDDIVNREAGNDAFLPLAEKWGGEVPPWMAALEPYIAAGVYMGSTIVTAKQVEAQVIEDARQAQKAQQESGGDGEEPKH